MPKEVSHTLKLYLDGKIEQFWFRENAAGVIFLMDVISVRTEPKRRWMQLTALRGGVSRSST